MKTTLAQFFKWTDAITDRTHIGCLSKCTTDVRPSNFIMSLKLELMIKMLTLLDLLEH